MDGRVEYPAIAIVEGESFHVVQDPIVECTSRAWRNGYFDRLQLFDSAGTVWAVAKSALARPPSLVDRLLNRRVAVNVELEPSSPRPLSEVAQTLCQLVDQDPDDVYCQFVPHERLKELLCSAASPRELLSVATSLGEAT